MWTFRRGVIAAGMAALFVALPPTAPAHEDRELESAIRGADHAAEHAAQARAVERARREWLAMTPAARRKAEARVAAALAPADEVGRWETQTVPFPTWAINAVVVPTGEVMFWGRSPIDDPDTRRRENASEAWLWDPGTGELDEVPPPPADLDGDGEPDGPAPLFCSGQSLLPTGEVLVTGGNLAYPGELGPDFAGLDRVYTFDPFLRTWTEQPPMGEGRWYPTQVELADGRTAIVAGYVRDGSGRWNTDLEVFAPARERGGVGTVTRHEAGSIVTGSYPHAFTLPDGSVVLAGHDQDAETAQAARLDPAGLDAAAWGSAWDTGLPRLGWFGKASQAALLLGDRDSAPRVTVIGGYGRNESPRAAVPTARTMTFGSDPLGWAADAIPDQNVARAYANLVELPDGTLVTVGGGSGADGPADQNHTGGDTELRRVELLRPGVDTAWRLGPPQLKWRTYHSTAVLLPDARVLSAGDDYWSMANAPDPYTAGDEAEIYSPPYLFDGDGPAARPEITSLPSGSVLYGEAIDVGVAGPAAAGAVLVAPAATTHGVNMSQRRVELEVTGLRSGGIGVRLPETQALAPPGWYMLFALDAGGTPSEAGWVHLATERPPGEDPDPGPDSDPDEDPPPTTTPQQPADPSTPPAAVAADTTAPSIRMRVRRVTRDGRRAIVRVRSSEPGRARLRLRRDGRRALTARLKLSADRSRAVRVRLPAATEKRLRRGRSVRLKATLTVHDAAGNRARIEDAARLRVRR